MAEPNKKSKIGYGDLGRIGEVIQSGLLDEYDIVFTKDTHEIVFIDPNKNKLKMQARISYGTEEDALAEGQVATNKTDITAVKGRLDALEAVTYQEISTEEITALFA